MSKLKERPIRLTRDGLAFIEEEFKIHSPHLYFIYLEGEGDAWYLVFKGSGQPKIEEKEGDKEDEGKKLNEDETRQAAKMLSSRMGLKNLASGFIQKRLSDVEYEKVKEFIIPAKR